MADESDPAEVVTGTLDRLRAVLALVESGELPAGPDQLAWLRGAVAALDVVLANDPSRQSREGSSSVSG